MGPQALTLPASSRTAVLQTRCSRLVFCDARTRMPARSTNASSLRWAFSAKARSPTLSHSSIRRISGSKHVQTAKSEAETHADRVGVHRHAQVVAELGERRDFRHTLAYLVRCESQQEPSGHDVLVAGGFGIDPEGDAQQRNSSARPRHVSARGFISPRQDAQQGRLAGAIVTDQTDSNALADRQMHVVESTYGQPVAGVATDAPSRTMMQQPILQRTRSGAVDGEFDRDGLELKTGHEIIPSKRFVGGSAGTARTSRASLQVRCSRPQPTRRASVLLPTMVPAPDPPYEEMG